MRQAYYNPNLCFIKHEFENITDVCDCSWSGQLFLAYKPCLPSKNIHIVEINLKEGFDWGKVAVNLLYVCLLLRHFLRC